MATRVNPFHELYVGESIGADKFVNLFSDIIVEHALSLFQPGHVILKGLPGTGKSMLLNLLKPSVRIAYEKSSQKFPVPDDFSKFLGAGINLKRSGISDFGQRPVDDQFTISNAAIYFGDFMNYWIVADILNTIQKIHDNDINSLAKRIGIKYDETAITAFTKKLCQSECWLGFMKDVKDFEQFKHVIHSRITNYRAFLNYNTDSLPADIQNTKTIIGVPISRCVDLLREFAIISEDVNVFIRIDQFEELAWLNNGNSQLGAAFEEIIHKLLGMRDSNVSYRIGTRHFAWSSDRKMFGTGARLEKKRNYKEISIDAFLRRKENPRLWVFPKFAEDIFRRRINLSPYSLPNENESDLLSYVFGKGLSPQKRAENYLPNDRTKAIKHEDHWPTEWKNFLNDLTLEDPLSARLGEAWARQKDKEDIVTKKKWNKPYPWDEKKWWRKERIEQALTQIASRNQQQLIWYGKDDILGLSGGHILIFLSLCQHIFDVWMQDNRKNTQGEDLILPKIDSVIQSAGIRETSVDWFNDISTERGGKGRKLFIEELGISFYRSLVEDRSMSYPGHNGFSLTEEELEQYPTIFNFLKEASDYGDLYDSPHTTKLNDKKARIKWYLNPILSPHFKIPYSHTKEPLYCGINQIVTWIEKAGVYIESLPPQESIPKPKKRKRPDNDSAPTLNF